MKTSTPLFACVGIALLQLASPSHAQNSKAHTAEPSLHTLDATEVKGVAATPMRPGALRDELVKTESITAEAMARKGVSNLTEAMEAQPGISVQTECSICNVRNVLLNNLPGRYTTVMVDGIPIYSSVSSAYGLESVGTEGIERIDVARGAGASLIAPESLSGTVNVISKKPNKDEGHLNVEAGNFGSHRISGFAAWAGDGHALTESWNWYKHDSVDGDGDGISEFTGYDRRMLGLGFFVDDVAGFDVRTRLDIIREDRGGGALGDDYRAIMNSNSGQPFNFSVGQHGSPFPDGWIVPSTGACLPYNDGRGGFSEIIFTDREQWIASGEKPLGDGTLRLAVGVAHHEQDSFYEASLYAAEQWQYYTEASYRWMAGDWELTSGINYRYEDLDSQGTTTDGVHVDGIDNYVYRVPGVYVQGYRALLDEQLELNMALRYDDHNEFGGKWMPRVNALFHHTPWLSSRFSVGRGYRAPTSFFEQDHGILDTIIIKRDVVDMETSDNVSYSLNYGDSRFNITGSLNWTQIHNMALLDSGAEDANGNPITAFTSSPDVVRVYGADVSASYQWTPSLMLTGGAERTAYHFTPGTLVFARPDKRLFAGMSFERAGWEMDVQATWTGSMDLLAFHDDGSGDDGRFNFDGTPKLDKSPAFTTVDLRVAYHVAPNWELFVGANNLFDEKQVDTESFLFVDAEGSPDVVQIWGPARGRHVYAGIHVDW